jgi:hypothetical protein
MQVKGDHLKQVSAENEQKTLRIELLPSEIEADLKLDEQLKNACFTIQKRLSRIEWVIGLPDFTSRFVPYSSLFEMANRTLVEINKNASNWKPSNVTRANINTIIDQITDIEKNLLQKQEDYQKEAIFSMEEIELVNS